MIMLSPIGRAGDEQGIVRCSSSFERSDDLLHQLSIQPPGCQQFEVLLRRAKLKVWAILRVAVGVAGRVENVNHARR